MTNPIFVGVALRDDDHAPLTLAGELAAFIGAPLVLVHIYPDEPAGWLTSPEFSEALQEDALRGLATAREQLPADLDVTLQADGSFSPVRGLHDAAIVDDASLLIVGSSHRGPLRRVMPGGVGERLLHAAPCAVALAPRAYEGVEGGIRRIGVAFIDTPEGHEALDAATTMATLGDATLSVHTVVEPLPVGSAAMMPGWVAPVAYDDPGPRLLRAEESIRTHLPEGLDVETNVREGEPAGVLAEASSDLDLLVCGSRGYGPLRTVLVGGVSGRLAHTARCPLLVVPRMPVRARAGQHP
jgi:nucleotide-binding universal stress UspA family protein